VQFIDDEAWAAEACFMHDARTPLLTPHQARVIAVRAGCDPRTVVARLRRKKNQPSTVVARIDAAIEELGLEFPPPTAA
jgi:hypothetical protein